MCVHAHPANNRSPYIKPSPSNVSNVYQNHLAELGVGAARQSEVRVRLPELPDRRHHLLPRRPISRRKGERGSSSISDGSVSGNTVVVGSGGRIDTSRSQTRKTNPLPPYTRRAPNPKQTTTKSVKCTPPSPPYTKKASHTHTHVHKKQRANKPKNASFSHCPPPPVTLTAHMSPKDMATI